MSKSNKKRKKDVQRATGAAVMAAAAAVAAPVTAAKQKGKKDDKRATGAAVIAAAAAVTAPVTAVAQVQSKRKAGQLRPMVTVKMHTPCSSVHIKDLHPSYESNLFVGACAYSKCLRRGTPKGSKVSGIKTTVRKASETPRDFERRVTDISTRCAVPTTMCFDCNASLHIIQLFHAFPQSGVPSTTKYRNLYTRKSFNQRSFYPGQVAFECYQCFHLFDVNHPIDKLTQKCF